LIDPDSEPAPQARRSHAQFHRFLLALFAAVRPPEAHPLIQEPMWILSEPGHIRVAVNVSAREIGVAQGLEAREDGAIPMPRGWRMRPIEKENMSGGICESWRMAANSPARLRRSRPLPSFASDEKTLYQYELDYPVSGPEPSKITISQEMLREFPYAAGMAWDVSYVVRLKRAGSDEITTGLLSRTAAFRVPTRLTTGEAGTPARPAAGQGWSTFRKYLWHGVMHILTGYDHLLFVSALVLATVSFWDMVKVIAAFTLAHTITLALSVFDILRLPPWVVEPVIALSIVFVALENVLWPRRSRSWVRLAVAFSFGLVHGLGFAGGLLDAMAGLPAIGIWIALGAFSLGVEIGHQVVVLPLFGLLALGRRFLHEGFAKPAMRYGSLAISLCGAYYLCVAVHEQFFSR
jgi:hypothetical protein